MSLPRYPTYKDSGVEWLGKVPEHWRTMRLRQLASIKNGRDYKGVEIESGGYPVIGSGGEFARANQFLYRGESVLLGRKGTIDRPMYLDGPFWTVDTMFYTIVRPETHPKFLYYCATTICFDRYSTNTALPSMSQADLGEIRFAVPEYHEQLAISSFLDLETGKIDALVHEQQRLIELLKEKRQAIISHAVTSGLKPDAPMKDSGFEWLGLVRSDWSTVAVKDLANPGRNTFTDGDWVELPFITDEGIRLIQTGNVGTGSYKEQGFRYISPESFDELGCTEILPNDVLICRLDGPVGRACIVPDLKVRMITSVDNTILKVREDIEPRFVVYLMSSEPWLKWLAAICRVGGGFRVRVSRKMLGDLRIPCPPYLEQVEIANFLDKEFDAIDSLISQAQSAIDLLQERRIALISAAVTGKIDVCPVVAEVVA